jgi:pimeloyl-ACP methyl ester carboxylesterase
VIGPPGDLPLVAVPGGRVEYLDVPGDPGLSPLLLLHEGLGSVALWRGWPQVLAAATGRRVVAYSRLGHGFSDLPAAPRTVAFMHEEAATVVPAVREALRMGDPVLVGHSDGASIALVHAATHPVAGLVVLAPHVIAEPVGLVGVAAARDAFRDGDLAARMARHHRDARVTFHNWNDVWLSDAFRSWDLRPLLPAITAPVLAIQGTADPYGTVLHVEAVRDGVSGPVELMVLDGGHAPHLEAQTEVTAAVAGFLAGRRVTQPSSPPTGPG